MDRHPASSTLFLHEDTLTRTLSYEQDLLKWRINELDAGRPDPGRPSYYQVFGNARTQHRYHYAADPFPRKSGNTTILYHKSDCPGIDDPASRNHFPIIDTLLSIPFSLLHNSPRLASMVPLSTYQQQLLVMASEIIRLWWWEPSFENLKRAARIRLKNIFQGTQNDVPNARPDAINHRSRKRTKFSENVPSLHFPRVTNSPKGPIFIRIPTHPNRPMDEMSPIDGDENIQDLEHADESIMASATGFPATSHAWTETEDEGYVEDKSTIYLSSADIVGWSWKVINSRPEPPPLTSDSFERGAIASMAVNDILMIKGLINPAVYIQFFDLSLFKFS